MFLNKFIIKIYPIANLMILILYYKCLYLFIYKFSQSSNGLTLWNMIIIFFLGQREYLPAHRHPKRRKKTKKVISSIFSRYWVKWVIILGKYTQSKRQLQVGCKVSSKKCFPFYIRRHQHAVYQQLPPWPSSLLAAVDVVPVLHLKLRGRQPTRTLEYVVGVFELLQLV